MMASAQGKAERTIMRISSAIEKAAKVNSITIEKLERSSSEKIKSQIYQKYIKTKKGIFLWEKFEKFSTLQDSAGWKLLSDFVGEKECLMFFENGDNTIIRIRNGSDLHSLLYEMFGFEFYITNFETDYVLCFNHHDCLVGCGTAKAWIEELDKERIEQGGEYGINA